MRLGSKKKRTCLAVSILVVVLFLGSASDSQAIERLRVTVGDTTGTAGQQNSVITVFLTNTMDDIFAFTLHLVLTRNDIANFQTQLDTIEEHTYWNCLEWVDEVCMDSVAVDFPEVDPWDIEHVDTIEVFLGNFDTVGTLISGWEMVTSRAVSTGELGLDIKLSAISDQADPPAVVPPISPQGGGVLFRLLADIFPIPPEQEDRTATIMIDVEYKPYFIFSTPEGEAIGWISVEVPDTNYYMCDEWEPEPPYNCYDWIKVPSWECPPEGCDSVEIVMVEVAVLDEEAVKVFNGSITVLETCCAGRVGDANGIGGDEPTIGDISVIIDALFISANWSGISCIEEADVNQSGGVGPGTEDITIGDISVLIDYLFITGPTLGLPDCL